MVLCPSWQIRKIWWVDLVGHFLGRWESADSDAALVAMRVKDLVGLLFGLRQGEAFRPIEARFLTADAFQLGRSAVQDLLDRWALETPREVATLSTTGMRELPMGQLVGHLGEPESDKPLVDLSMLLTEDVEHAAVNNLIACRFRNARELRSRIQQLKAAYYYATAVAEGDTSPLERVALRLELRGEHPKSRAGTLVQYARKNGYLSESISVGRAGGGLTEAALVDAREIARAGGLHV